MVDVVLLHGPNLSQLGSRDPEHYGTATLDDVVSAARSSAADRGAELTHLQTEHEGELVTRIHDARSDGTDILIINAGAWSHYSVAIRDALELLTIPKVEVHLSNITAREPFRHTSLMTAVCDGAILGFGIDGYPLAVQAGLKLHAERQQPRS